MYGAIRKSVAKNDKVEGGKAEINRKQTKHCPLVHIDCIKL